MKRSLFQVLGSTILALGLFFTAPVWAQQPAPIVYDGTNPAMLQDIYAYLESLGPPGSANPNRKSNFLSSNRIEVTGGVIPGGVFGAINQVDADAITGNRITLGPPPQGGDKVVVDIAVWGGLHSGSYNTSVRGNEIFVHDATLRGIYGGRAISTDVSEARAEGNKIAIYGYGAGHPNFLGGGDIVLERDIVGGYASGYNPIARDNTVSIYGTPVLDPNTRLRGGVVDNYGGIAGNPGISIGNLLEYASIGLSVSEVDYFQVMDFHLPTALANGDKMLSVTHATDLTGVTVRYLDFEIPSAPPMLAHGNEYILIENVTGTFTPKTGTLGTFPYVVRVDNGNLVLRIGAVLTTGAYSRMVHGAAGPFNLPIDPNGSLTPGQPITIEPRRSGDGVFIVVFQFAAAVGTASATLTGAGTVVETVPNGNEVIVRLTDVPDGTRLGISLTVNGITNTASANIGFLSGKVDDGYVVNQTDVTGVRTHVGAALSDDSFIYDLNADGTINQSDVTSVRTAVGQVLQ